MEASVSLVVEVHTRCEHGGVKVHTGRLLLPSEGRGGHVELIIALRPREAPSPSVSLSQLVSESETRVVVHGVGNPGRLHQRGVMERVQGLVLVHRDLLFRVTPCLIRQSLFHFGFWPMQDSIDSNRPSFWFALIDIFSKLKLLW